MQRLHRRTTSPVSRLRFVRFTFRLSRLTTRRQRFHRFVDRTLATPITRMDCVEDDSDVGYDATPICANRVLKKMPACEVGTPMKSPQARAFVRQKVAKRCLRRDSLPLQRFAPFGRLTARGREPLEERLPAQCRTLRSAWCGRPYRLVARMPPNRAIPATSRTGSDRPPSESDGPGASSNAAATRMPTR